MAAEYARMGSLALAERLLAQASRMCPGDPLPAHERGVLALRAGEWATAEAWLRRALDLAAERGGGGGGGKLGGPSSLSSSSSLPFLSTSAAIAWEPALVNLGHAVRKQGRYDEAAGLYEAALALSPRQAGTLAALGFARQLAGDSRGAADAYHQCLALRPDDAFALEMLSEALAEEYERFVADEGRQEREERAGGGGGGAAAPPRYDAFLRPAQQQQQRRRRQQEMGQHFHHDDDDMVIA
jgi:anaphase-promoting complex subunit 6